MSQASRPIATRRPIGNQNVYIRATARPESTQHLNLRSQESVEDEKQQRPQSTGRRSTSGRGKRGKSDSKSHKPTSQQYPPDEKLEATVCSRGCYFLCAVQVQQKNQMDLYGWGPDVDIRMRKKKKKRILCLYYWMYILGGGACRRKSF